MAAISYDDPDIGIDWGLSGPPDTQRQGHSRPLLRDFKTPFTYEGRAMKKLVTGGAGFIGSAVVRHAGAGGA